MYGNEKISGAILESGAPAFLPQPTNTINDIAIIVTIFTKMFFPLFMIPQFLDVFIILFGGPLPLIAGPDQTHLALQKYEKTLDSWHFIRYVASANPFSSWPPQMV